MSEVTVYECDVTGERYEDRTDVVEVDIVRRRTNGWDTWAKTAHVAESVIESNGSPDSIQRVFVERDGDGPERITGYEYEHHGWNNDKGLCYEDRDSVMVSPWDEQLFDVLEKEVLHGHD